MIWMSFLQYAMLFPGVFALLGPSRSISVPYKSSEVPVNNNKLFEEADKANSIKYVGKNIVTSLRMSQRQSDINIELKSVKLLSNRELKTELNKYIQSAPSPQSSTSSSSQSAFLKQKALGAFDRRDLEHVVAEYRVQKQASKKADALQFQRQKQIEAMRIRDEIQTIESTCSFRDMIHELKEAHAMEFDMIPVDDKHMVATYLALARLNLTATHYLPETDQTAVSTSSSSKTSSTSSTDNKTKPRHQRNTANRNTNDGDKVDIEDGKKAFSSAASAVLDDVKTSVARYGPQVNVISNIFDVQTDLEKLIKQRKKAINQHQHQHEKEEKKKHQKQGQRDYDNDDDGDIDAMIKDTITTTRSRYSFTTTPLSTSSTSSSTSASSSSKSKERSRVADTHISDIGNPTDAELTDGIKQDSTSASNGNRGKGSNQFSSSSSFSSSQHDYGDENSEDDGDVYRVDNRIYFPGQQPSPQQQEEEEERDIGKSVSDDIDAFVATRTTEDEDIDDNNDDEDFDPNSSNKRRKMNSPPTSRSDRRHSSSGSGNKRTQQQQRVSDRRSVAQVDSIQFASELIMKSFIGTFLLFFRQFLPWTTITSFSNSISSLLAEICQNFNFPAMTQPSGGWGIRRMNGMLLSGLIACERFVMTLVARLALWSTGNNKLGSVVLFLATALCIVFRKGVTWFVLSFLIVRILRIAIYTSINDNNSTDSFNHQNNSHKESYRNLGQDI